MQAADWDADEKHQTRISADQKVIERQLDGDAYYVTLQHRGQLSSASDA